MTNESSPVVAVVGPTASAKSTLAMRLAQELGSEIVSVDSMQVYRGLNIGTAKPSDSDRRAVPHHVVDVVDPEDTFTVAEHQRLGIAVLADLGERRVLPLVTGGSGLHFRAVVDPLEFPPTDSEVRDEIESLASTDAVLALLEADAGAGSVVDLANPRRVARALEIYRLTGHGPSERSAGVGAAAVRAYESRMPLVVLGMDPGDLLSGRIEARFDAMLAGGLLQEVERMAPRLGATAAQGVGYKELVPVVRGEVSMEAGRDAAVQATRALAKRQRTYFRRDPRINWIPWSDRLDEVVEYALAAIGRGLEETV